MGKDRLEQIEQTVNGLVMTGSPVTWSHMPIAEARAKGAMALFGEKYPEIVRVVRMGEFSRELCGGTHLDNVGQVGLFKIVGEESVAAGTRRITALTGVAALELVRQEERYSYPDRRSPPRSTESGSGPGRDSGRRDQKSEETEYATPNRSSGKDFGRRSGRRSDDCRRRDRGDPVRREQSPDEFRVLIDGLRRKVENGLAVLLISVSDGKVQLVAGLSRDLIERGLHAGNWLKQVAPVVGGGGGGRPDLAQAGGKNPEKIPDALNRR